MDPGAVLKAAPRTEVPGSPWDWLAAAEAELARLDGRNVVFLVGCPRSGTTWLQRLLAGHPRIKTGQESHLFNSYLGRLVGTWRREVRTFTEAEPGSHRGGVGLGCYLEEEDVVRLARSFVAKLLHAADVQPGELFLEKTPRHALHLPVIREVLPASRVIHLVRDPRDVTASLLAASRSWGARWAPKTAREAARLWRTYLETVRKETRLFEPGRFLELRYEDLRAHPQEELERLLGFFDLEWSREDLAAAIAQNSAASARAGAGTPIPVFGVYGRLFSDTVQEPEGFVRAGGSGRGRALSLRQRLALWYELADLMRQEGYAWTRQDWLPDRHATTPQ